jgi:hypothetical protein
MILSQEQWMNLRAFKALAEAGATWAEIARETGYDWRTVKRYLSSDAGSSPPAPAKRGPGPRLIDPYAHLIDAWLRRQPKLKASVIWERLVTEHGFPGHYQRVKVYVREHRARLTQAEPEPVGFHRRFEVLPGRPSPGRLGRRGRAPDRDRTAAGVELPHDLVVFPRPVLLLCRRPGPGHLLGLPPAGVRPLRRGARTDRL